MILTKELFELGKSSNNGWSEEQLRLFGIEKYLLIKGWKHTIIGKDFPKEVIDRFLALKDAHLKGKQRHKHLFSDDAQKSLF